ncbi:MAG: VCBS repeat-containing protein [Bacteroidia bacterium]|nr:VCBS repeat-containing protein [Bacteroidia bacterium]
MDGQRLIDPTGNYAYDGTFYHTENESFSKILSHGSTGSSPEYFTVETKEGYYLEYGHTSDSRIEAQGGVSVLLWYINKIQDRQGNYMTFTYHEDNANGEAWIERIDYTGNGNLAPYNSVRFYYELRKDVSTAYYSGSVYNQRVLLHKIRAYSNDIIVKEYEFKYSKDETETKFDVFTYLTEVLEYGKDRSNYNSTIFSYGATGSSFQHTTSNILDEINEWSDKNEVFTGDFNGDGLSDLLLFEYDYTEAPDPVVKYYKWYNLFINNNDGNFTLDDWTDGGSLPYHFQTIDIGPEITIPNSFSFTFSDYNGDGKDDFIATNWDYDGSYNRLNNIGIYYAANVGFNYYNISFSGVLYNIILPNKKFFYSGDFDGDGTTDFITLLSNGSDYNAEICYPRNGYTKYLIPDDGVFDAGNVVLLADNVFVVDYNGDGKSDLMVVDESNTTIFTFNKQGSTVNADVLYSGGYPTKWHKIFPGDFNGDGKTDILTCAADAPVGNKYIGFSNGSTGFNEVYFTYSSSTSFNENYHEIQIGDYNGDGKSDLLVAYNWSTPPSKVDIYYSTGMGFYYKSNPFYDSIPYANSTVAFFPSGDFNGDGKLDEINSLVPHYTFFISIKTVKSIFCIIL